MWNPPAIARANVDKIYLKDLEAAGIAIPTTRWIDRAGNASIASVMREEHWDRAVLKTAHRGDRVWNVPDQRRAVA
jgi:hypothetical protein